MPIKSAMQLDLQALHRARVRLVAQRTGLINQIRAFLLERGIALRQAVWPGQGLARGARGERRARPDDARPARAAARALAGAGRRIAALDQQILSLARTHPTARRLITIPGIGALIATALIAAIDGGQAFRRARDLACWLGLVPRQHSTGGQPRLLGIGKRGNGYLRRLLVHAARSVKRSAQTRDDRLGGWLRALEARAHPNVATVALAAKLAR